MSMARNKKHDDALKNGINNCDQNRSVATWSNLSDDVLFLVMMRLGVVDFLAFRVVCKSWRSLAFSNMNKFIASRPPMSISFSNDAYHDKKCYLEDFEGRKISTIVPHSGGRTCIGVTCGYLILCSWRNFWLVNPITRHELYFPNVPDHVFCCHGYGCLRGTLVISPSISEWKFVVLSLCSPTLWSSIAGKYEWTNESLSRNVSTWDWHASNRNIYILDDYGHPSYVETFPIPDLRLRKFVRCGEKLYLINQNSKLPDMNIHERDLGIMKWVSRENTGEKYVLFRNKFRDIATIPLREVWVDLRAQYDRYVFANKNGKGRMFGADMWYFFQDCLNYDIIHE